MVRGSWEGRNRGEDRQADDDDRVAGMAGVVRRLRELRLTLSPFKPMEESSRNLGVF